ncbi:hypothetical protein GN958_ATG12286 [Phytophthora infestans]|uniref:Uncharacterized protein n=1 Tax=Phytophthora infestans TaxID=4787 RepID=A0A8S9UHY1_PHYIN|nr:hypothetical protein GN958_ATG12286 [Phytophthora infestans]
MDSEIDAQEAYTTVKTHESSAEKELDRFTAEAGKNERFSLAFASCKRIKDELIPYYAWMASEVAIIRQDDRAATSDENASFGQADSDVEDLSLRSSRVNYHQRVSKPPEDKSAEHSSTCKARECLHVTQQSAPRSDVVCLLQRRLTNCTAIRGSLRIGGKPSEKDAERAYKFADEFSKTDQFSLEEFSVVSHIVGSAKFAFAFNTDHTAVYIGMNPNTTIDFVGTIHVDVVQGVSENALKASVFLCASATGDKLPLMIIFTGVVSATFKEEV